MDQEKVEIFAAEFNRRIDELKKWVESQLPGAKGRKAKRTKMHRRLELFALYYKRTVGKDYKPGSLAGEGGAAKRTELKCNFYEYRNAVRSYMAQTYSGVIAGNSYMNFISYLNHWLMENQGKKVVVSRYG